MANPPTRRYKGKPLPPNPYVATPEQCKAAMAVIHEESARMCDTAVKREDVRQVLLIALTQKDVDNLYALAEGGRIKNFGVLVRRLVAREAKAKASAAKAPMRRR